MVDEDLPRFGWAPGGYEGGKCRDCAERLEDVDKRAWRCKRCAEAAFWEWQGIQNAPLICDDPGVPHA